jgi:hypothetical protein
MHNHSFGPARAAITLALGLVVGGCVPAPGGAASFSVVSRKLLSAQDGVEMVGRIDKSLCSHVALFFIVWGEADSHEAIIQSELERLGADAITNAELTSTSIPAVVYNRQCARVVGDAIRFKRGGT